MKPCLIPTLILLTLLACNIGSQPQPVGPTRAELCRALGRDLQTDQLCESGDGLKQLLEASFPPKVATKDEVSSRLGQYLLDSHLRAIGGTSETYVIEKGIFTPVIAIFSFDKEGILVSITIED